MMVTTIFSFVLVLLGLSANVKGQACRGTSQYSACSTNSECGCLQYSFASSYGICGVITSGCSQFTPCQANDACAQGHVCVRHPTCDSRSLCYPMSLAQQNRCPTLITMTTTTRPSVMVSTYTGELTTTDGQFIRPGATSSGHYYEAIQIIADTTGTYEIKSSSSMDTHGFLYTGTFDPANSSTNLTVRDDDGGGSNQFKLSVTLEAGVPYTVVVSTHGVGVTGAFSVIATGPGDVQYTRIQ